MGGAIMAIAWAVPLVLSCVYPLYGEQVCRHLQDEEDHVKKQGPFDWVVVVIGVMMWGIIFALFGYIVFTNYMGDSVHNGGQDPSVGIVEDALHPFHPPFNGTSSDVVLM